MKKMLFGLIATVMLSVSGNAQIETKEEARLVAAKTFVSFKNQLAEAYNNTNDYASYEKIGTSNITFIAGAGATLTTLSGTATLSGIAGSKACLSRNGNTYYLQITNY